MKNKIYDCITFTMKTYKLNLRINILNDYVDKFVICESIYDHKGKKKNLTLKLRNLNNLKIRLFI